MIRISFPALILATLFAATTLVAQADDSTGPTQPTPKGTNPTTIGVPAGTSKGMSNGNTDGSADTASPTNSNSSILQLPANEGKDKAPAKGKPGTSKDDDDDDDDN